MLNVRKRVLPGTTTTKPQVMIVGGPDVHTRIELMEQLSNDFHLSAAGTQSHHKSAFKQAGFTYHRYPMARRMNPIADVYTFASLLRIFQRTRPNIIHTFDTKPSVFARLAGRVLGVPVIVGTIPGLGSLYVSEGLSTRVARTIYEKLQMLASFHSDMTIFQNHFDARQFIESGITPASKARVIRGSGVRTDRYDPASFSSEDKEQIRVQFGIPNDALLITMVSRIMRSKGILEFGAAAQAVRRSHPHVKFLLVGASDEENEDQLTKSESHQLERLVTCVGERDDIPAILAASDIFVLPTSYREGIPRVLLEAASMGLPIIASNSPGCREAVEHGINGLLVQPCDSDALAHAILLLAEEPSLRRQLGRGSRLRAVAQFDLSKVAKEIHSVYRELLEQKGMLSVLKA